VRIVRDERDATDHAVSAVLRERVDARRTRRRRRAPADLRRTRASCAVASTLDGRGRQYRGARPGSSTTSPRDGISYRFNTEILGAARRASAGGRRRSTASRSYRAPARWTPRSRTTTSRAGSRAAAWRVHTMLRSTDRPRSTVARRGDATQPVAMLETEVDFGEYSVARAALRRVGRAVRDRARQRAHVPRSDPWLSRRERRAQRSLGTGDDLDDLFARAVGRPHASGGRTRSSRA
jgi:hypothetical protein